MNREITFLIILFFATVFLMVGANFIQFQEGHFPVSAANWLLIGLITLWVSFRLLFSSAKDFQLRVFGLFFLSFSLFILIMALAHLPLFIFHEGHEIFERTMHLGYAVGHIFLYLSFAIFIRLPLKWLAPNFQNLGSAFFLLLGGVTTVLNFLLPSSPEFSHATGVTLLNVNPLVGKLVAVNASLAWVPAGIYFIIKGVRSQEKNVRGRALLLGIGLIIATIGGPLHDISQQAMMFLVADIVVLAGIVIVASGVMYQKKTVIDHRYER